MPYLTGAVDPAYHTSSAMEADDPMAAQQHAVRIPAPSLAAGSAIVSFTKTFLPWLFVVVVKRCLCSLLMRHERCAHGLSYSLQRQMKEMGSLKNDFTKYLATADSSLLHTNNLLQQMDKSQKVAEAPRPVRCYCQEVMQ